MISLIKKRTGGTMFLQDGREISNPIITLRKQLAKAIH